MNHLAERPESNPQSQATEPAVAGRRSWKAVASEWLEDAGRRVGVPSLVVGLIALLLSAISLSYIIANYRLAIAGNRPFLVSYGMKADSQRAEVGFNNVGKLTARRGRLTLFSLAQKDAIPQKLTSIIIPIVGAGTNIFPGAGSNAIFDPQLIEKEIFILACATYFDDAGTVYEQAFLFSGRQAVVGQPGLLSYPELDQPAESRCHITGGYR